MLKSKIVSTGAYLPIQRVSSADIMAETNCDFRFGVKHQILESLLGIKELRWADTSVKPSTLAIESSIQAIKSSGRPLEEIDMVLFCGITRDYEEPSTAHTVQASLGLNTVPCFDISNACHGFIDGMLTADGFIKAGRAKLVLVCTGEISSRASRRLIKKIESSPWMGREEFKTLIGHFSLGDGGGAALIGISDSDAEIGYMNTRCDGNYSKFCYYEFPDEGIFKGAMLMSDMSRFFKTFNEDIIDETYKKLDWKSADVDFLISHQIGVKPHEQILALSGVPSDRAPSSYELCGNLTSATIPYNLNRIDLSPGKKILLFGAGSGATISQGGITT